jgi:hypothetical protein
MDQAQAERVAEQILFTDSSIFQQRILQRSAKKGQYTILYCEGISWFSGPTSETFQSQYNLVRSEIVKRLVSMDVIQGERRFKWKVA